MRRCEKLFGYGTQYQPGNPMAAVRSQHQQINLIALTTSLITSQTAPWRTGVWLGRPVSRPVQDIRDIF